MTPETNPPQPEEVAQAIADALGANAPATDPWWEAGLEESLEE